MSKVMIEIDETSKVEQRRTEKGNNFFRQDAYMHVEGEKYPVKVRVPVEDIRGHSVGMYEIDWAANVRTSRYDDVELNPFQMKLIRISK